MTSSRAPHAIIFDLDGTLVDTVGTRVDSWMAVFPTFGIEAEPAFLAPLMGSDGKLLARMTAEHYGVELGPGDDARIDIAAGDAFRVLNANPRALPGANDILESLTDRGMPWAVATSSLPDEARESVASVLPGLRASGATNVVVLRVGSPVAEIESAARGAGIRPLVWDVTKPEFQEVFRR